MDEKTAQRLMLESGIVSRETMSKLKIYAALLEKWNPKINLVAKPTLKEKWVRHFLDSYQIWTHAPRNVDIWCDLGSGAGFPGLVAAVIASDISPDTMIHLVESDARKSAFLRSVAREMELPVQIHTKRIEQLDPIQCDIVSARALAPLSQLLSFAHPVLKKNGVCLFLKGKSYQSEIEEAQKSWHFNIKKHQSLSQPDSAVLEISEVRPNDSE